MNFPNFNQRADCCTSNRQPNKNIGESRKADMLGREGVCTKLASHLFLMDMAVEGCVVSLL